MRTLLNYEDAVANHGELQDGIEGLFVRVQCREALMNVPVFLRLPRRPTSKVCNAQWLRDIFRLWREYNSLRYLFVFEEKVLE
jgi:hypothetical protein